jgi:site-specific DNA-methyltransferase (adenine-specific)
MSDFYTNTYNPDVLSCLANLSNDEVFTPPEIVNKMLDMLPQELFSDKSVTFLDPACKSGVFLREIAKRLLTGLEGEIPDLQERIEHIFHKQLYGIAITEMTSLLSRRSVYCSKYPNGKFSIAKFDDAEGNIRYKRLEHYFRNGKCAYCGASEAVDTYSRDMEQSETYAYELIHTTKPEEIFKMKFDVIIGNPPYQLSFGIEGVNSANAGAIYHKFISQAINLKPRYLCMITPSRWMTRTQQGLPDTWIDEMLNSKHFQVMHDFPFATDCFPGVEIKGGVNYFLWNRDYSGKCEYVFHYPQSNDTETRVDYLDPIGAGVVVRDPKSYSIIEKIKAIEKDYYVDTDKNFSGLVSPKHYFDDSQKLTSNWKQYKPNRDNVHSIKYYVSKSFNDMPFGWIAMSDLPKNHATLPLHKVYIPAAGGSGTDQMILGKPFYGEPNSVCSQTYLVIGYDADKHHYTKRECDNIITYIKTKFFRYLVSIKKKTQNGPRGVYQFVPLQDFSESWTDEKLYAKYGITEDEIAFIESMIRPMELGGGGDE